MKDPDNFWSICAQNPIEIFLSYISNKTFKLCRRKQKCCQSFNLRIENKNLPSER